VRRRGSSQSLPEADRSLDSSRNQTPGGSLQLERILPSRIDPLRHNQPEGEVRRVLHAAGLKESVAAEKTKYELGAMRTMYRRATEREKAAFLLVARTVRRTRPQLSRRGLESVVLPTGTITRGTLGRLRLLSGESGSDGVPEDRHETRSLSDDERSSWVRIKDMVSKLGPIADSDGNLVSMHLGQRFLCLSPHGTVFTIAPDGTSAFGGSFDPSVPERKPGLEMGRPHIHPLRWEAGLLAAIDAFVADATGTAHVSPETIQGWDPARASRAGGSLRASSPMRGRKFGHGKWSKCPLCHAPVVMGRFNPRIPYGRLRPGSGSIVDLRGGYLSRLRETYIVEEQESVIESSESIEEPTSDSQQEQDSVR